VHADRLFADEQVVGDAPVAEPVGEQREDLPFRWVRLPVGPSCGVVCTAAAGPGRGIRARSARAWMLRASQAAPDQIDAAIAKWDLATALASLRPRDRNLLTARYLRDRSIGQIAADLNIPAGTVKSRLTAARDALRRKLQSGNGSAGPRGTAIGGLPT